MYFTKYRWDHSNESPSKKPLIPKTPRRRVSLLGRVLQKQPSWRMQRLLPRRKEEESRLRLQFWSANRRLQVGEANQEPVSLE